MKTKSLLSHATLLAFLLSTFNPQFSTVLAQGSLTPPGAPAPTMKTLAQIEPRTPISSAPFTINTSGSYYLTTNLTTTVSNAIVITASGVTLDLSGFTISSTVPNAMNGGFAIGLTANLSDLTIFNGHIRSGVTNSGGGYGGSGFASGISIFATSPVNARVSGVSVNGCLFDGIYLGTPGTSTVVEDCTLHTVGAGINANIVKNCVVVDCNGTAIFGGQVSDSRGESTGGGTGINAYVMQNCYGSSITGTALVASGTALNCYGSSFSGTGINAFIANCCRGAGSPGLNVSHNVNSF